jgi:DNA mismatch endonuclease Vsr
MSCIRGQDTSPEIQVRRILHRLGYRFRLHDRTLPGCPDIVFRSRKSVIFVHGCFWHQHSRCGDGHMPQSRLEYWVPKLERNRTRDKMNKTQLKRLGWRCLTVWECQVRDQSRLIHKLHSFLLASRNQASD